MGTREQLGRIISSGLGTSSGPTSSGASGGSGGSGVGGAGEIPPAASNGADGALQEALSELEVDLSTATVLVVDDNEQNLELLMAYLEDLCCECKAARNGAEALDVVASEPPDLILLDVMMPQMSGFQVCEKLKADPATRDIPIIVVTALNEVSDIERAVESGADDFLTKPVHKLELLTRTRSLLQVRLLRSRLREALQKVQDLTDEQVG